jgi:cobalamin biosynthesis Mg chelatase CobN
MARRGKAASRQARQRRRSGQRAATQRQQTQANTTTAASASGTTSTSAGPAAAASTPAAPRTGIPASQRGSRRNPRVIVAGSSRLSERAIEEYHYVRRDLRNIGILMAVMAVILVAAVLIFSALGIGKTA